jgi:hypothetical protein
MMGNIFDKYVGTPQRAIKGSQFWMQNYVNIEQLTNSLNAKILTNKSENITWKSPLAGNKFKECQLSQKYLQEILGDEKISLGFGFWPPRSSQWDAIGISETLDNKKTVYLVEAKAHLGEIISRCGSKDIDNKKLISSALEKTFDSIKKDENLRYTDVANYWENQYYQLGNRLTFLRELNKQLKELPNKKIIFKLVLLNFVKDWTWEKEKRVEESIVWTREINGAVGQMLCGKKPSEDELKDDDYLKTVDPNIVIINLEVPPKAAPCFFDN